MKLKSLSDLGGIYNDIAASKVSVAPIANTSNKEKILLTDATQYVPVKAGSALGGGPAVKKHDGEEVEPLASKTGPKGIKGNNFEEVTKEQDPGSDEKVMKKEEEHDEDVSKNTHQSDAAKVTTPKEKVKETVNENDKYHYQPKFTMSKLKFDQLYEEALKSVPFNEDADTMEQGEVVSADDAAADAPEVDAGAAPTGEEETTVTITLDKELARKLHDVLMGVLGSDEEQAADTGAEMDGVVAEDVEAEDEGHPLVNQKKGNADKATGSNQTGDLKAVKQAASSGNIKSEPDPKPAEKFDSKLQNTKGGANKTGTGTVVTTGKKAFE